MGLTDADFHLDVAIVLYFNMAVSDCFIRSGLLGGILADLRLS